MSENAQVKKLIQAYESLEGALDGFDWGTPQRCVLGSFTVDGVDGQDVTSHLVGNVSIELPEKSLGPSPVIAEVCAITVPGTAALWRWRRWTLTTARAPGPGCAWSSGGRHFSPDSALFA